MDGASTAKRGERNLYRLMRTLKKRGGGSSDYRLLRTLKRSPGNFGDRFPIFRHWALVHKREVTDTVQQKIDFADTDTVLHSFALYFRISFSWSGAMETEYLLGNRPEFLQAAQKLSSQKKINS